MSCLKKIIFRNILATKAGRFTAFFFLYITEGVPQGFTATALATQMRRQGVGPKEIGFFVGSLYLPWAWKWAIGPVVDLFYSDRFGKRRTWIVAMQVMMSLSLLAIIPIDFTTNMALLTGILIVHNMFGATQDVAIDALACGTLKEDERGLANGLMFGGAYVGQALGGSGVLFLNHYVDFNITLFFVVGCILSVMFFVSLSIREKPANKEITERPGKSGLRGHAKLNSGLKTLRGDVSKYLIEAYHAFTGTRGAFLGLIFAVLPAGAYAMSLPLQSNLAVELGMSDSLIGTLALISTVLSALGCVSGGFLSDKYGRRKMLFFYIISTSIPTVFLGFAMLKYNWIMPVNIKMPNRPIPPSSLMVVFWSCSIIYSIFQGLMFGTRTALFMDVCTPSVAATQFTAYMAILNFVIWYSSTWQGISIEKLGYPATLFIDASIGLLCLLVLPFVKKRIPVD